MISSGTSRSATAVCLLALLGVLATGLPSHHHERPVEADDAPGQQHVIVGDHHSHGAQLVEQDDRTPSTAPQMAGASSTVKAEMTPRVASPTAQAQDDLLRPMERAPPPGAPRAPPLSA